MPRCFHSWTARRQVRSSSSSVDGVSPRRVTIATAWPAATSVPNAPTTVCGVPTTAGRSRSVTSVITPRVPSEPTINPARSYPATPFVVLRPMPTAVPYPAGPPITARRPST